MILLSAHGDWTLRFVGYNDTKCIFEQSDTMIYLQYKTYPITVWNR